MIRFTDEFNDAVSVDSEDGKIHITYYPDSEPNPHFSNTVSLDIDEALVFSEELRKSIAKAKEDSDAK